MDDSHTFFWLVGMLEGEGTFLWYENIQRPAIEIEAKDEHIIARVAALWGVSYYRRDRRDRNPRSSVTYQARVTGRKAVNLMHRLKPYMSPRRQRAIQRVLDGYGAKYPDQDNTARIALPVLQELPYTLQQET